MRNLKDFYDKWSKTEEGNQSNWLDKNSSHYFRYQNYLSLSRPYINENTTVLDIGCGEGNLLSVLPACKKNGIDIAKRYVLIATRKNPKANIRIADIDKKLPFTNQSVDFIFCTEVIEHVNSPGHLLSEIRRILSRKGLALISTYNHWSLISIINLHVFRGRYISSDHLREYNSLSLKKLVKAHNFQIVSLNFSEGGCVISDKHNFLKPIGKIVNSLPKRTFINIFLRRD